MGDKFGPITKCINYNNHYLYIFLVRLSVLFGSSVSGSSPGLGYSVERFEQDTLLSQWLSPSTCVNGYRRI